MLEPGALYFAYGCNMDVEFLSGVIGASVRPGSVACINGWRLAFNKGGEGEGDDEVVANLVEADCCRSYGVVYSLPKAAFAPLDAFEDVPQHYRRTTIWVEPVGRQARQATLVYLAQPSWVVDEGTPATAYLALMLRGALSHGLPGDYIEWIVSLAGGDTRQYPRS
jgi:hypothetical protein